MSFASVAYGAALATVIFLVLCAVFSGERRARGVALAGTIGLIFLSATSACSVTAADSRPNISPDRSSGYVQPGSVGYKGSVGALAQYQRDGAVPPGQGCSWGKSGLDCSGNAQGDLVLDHAYVHGGIYFRGSGSATVTNSVIEGGGGSEWYVFYAASQSPRDDATLSFRDTTLRWASDQVYPAGYNVAPIWTRGAQPMDVQRCDISGLPQGLGATSGSRILNNHIHDVVQNSDDPDKPTHLDGIFSQGGSDILIQGNYVDVPVRNPSDVTAALFFQNSSATDKHVTVDSNFLRGGSYTLVNQTVVGLVVTNNIFGGGTFGDVSVAAPGTIGKWIDNKHEDGSSVPKP